MTEIEKLKEDLIEAFVTQGKLYFALEIIHDLNLDDWHNTIKVLRQLREFTKPLMDECYRLEMALSTDDKSHLEVDKGLN